MDDQLREHQIAAHPKKYIAMSTIQKQIATTSVSAPASIAFLPARIARGAALASLLLVLLLHFIKNDLAPGAHMLSEYALEPHGWVMKAAFLAWALSCFTLAIAIRSQVTTGAGRAGVVLLFVTTAALIMGALFVIDPPYAPIPQPTAGGALHGLSAMVGLPSQTIAALLVSYSLKKNGHWHSARTPIIRWAHAIWISLLLLFASVFLMMQLSGGQFNGDTGIGWFNRLLLFTNCAWLMTVAGKAMQIKANA
jgi:hypothetical protein